MFQACCAAATQHLIHAYKTSGIYGSGKSLSSRTKEGSTHQSLQDSPLCLLSHASPITNGRGIRHRMQNPGSKTHALGVTLAPPANSVRRRWKHTPIASNAAAHIIARAEVQQRSAWAAQAASARSGRELPETSKPCPWQHPPD